MHESFPPCLAWSALVFPLKYIQVLNLFHVLSVFYISIYGIEVSLLINLSDKPSCQHDVVPQEYKWEEAHLVVVKPKKLFGRGLQGGA